MDANCAGDRELTVPVCKAMSSLLLEELDEMADIRRVQKIRCAK